MIQNSKNKRKFRVWDNTRLLTTYEKVVQISGKIEELTDEQVEEPSVIPTEILYEIAVCYEAMFHALLDEHLLQAGYPKSDKSKTH